MLHISHSAAASAVRRIESDVESRYAPHLAQAGFLRRAWLRYRMRRELARRLESLAPRLPYLILK